MTKETDQQVIADIKGKRDRQRQQHAKGPQQQASPYLPRPTPASSTRDRADNRTWRHGRRRAVCGNKQGQG